MDDRDPLSYPFSTYAWVLGLSMAAGCVRYLNKMDTFVLHRFIIEAITSAFTGLIVFYLCDWRNVQGQLQGVFVAIAGLMGSRAWTEFEAFFKRRAAAALHLIPSPFDPPTTPQAPTDIPARKTPEMQVQEETP